MKWLIAVLSVFVMLVAALIVAPNFFDWNKYKKPALEQVEAATGLQIAVDGDVSLAVLPSPRVYLEKVSIKDPGDPQGQKMLASLDLLDVRVALMPLLKGQAVVNSIHLDKPVIALSRDAAGKFNFMTPKIEAMMSAKEALTQGQKDTQAKQNFSVFFESVSISDGAFTFHDPAQKQPVEIKNINLDVNANSLKGPFKGQGQFVYNGQPISFDAKTGEIDQALQSTSLNLDADVNGMQVKYAGVVTAGERPEVQGEAAVSIRSLERFLQKQNGAKAPAGLEGALSVSGLLSANAEKASLKNAALSVGGKSLEGALEITMSPLSVQGVFKGDDILDLDPFLPEAKGEQQAGFDPGSLGAALPKTLEIPELGNSKISLSVPGVVYKGQVLKAVQLDAGNIDKTFAAEMSSDSIPGQGRVALSGALSFAEKSKNAKTGTVIFSEPTGVFEVKGETQNLPVTVQALSGLNNLPLVKDSKRGVFEFSGKITPAGVNLSKGIVNIDDAAFSVNGSWTAQKGSPRSLLKATVVADKLDFDALSGGSGAPTGGDPLKPLKTLALPYDADVDITVNQAVLQGHDVKGLHIAAGLVPNQLKINKFAADSFVGSTIDVSGGIGDLMNMAGIDVKASVNTPDPYKLADAFKVDTSSWPKGLGITKADVVAQGSLSALDVDASVSAMDGEVGVKGKVSNPMAKPEISGLALSVRHPNMAKAISTFAPGAPNYASLAKPMVLKADVAMNEGVTTLSNISGDLAGASISGNARIDASSSKPSLSGKLVLGDLVLKSAAGATAGKSGAATSSGGKWSSAPMDSSWLFAMNANLDVAANSIVYETWDLQKPSLKMTLLNGVLEISDLQAGLYDGQISSTGTISSSGKGQPMNVKMASQIKNINMGALAKALAGSGRIQAEGDVSLDFDVTGAGASQKDLVGNLHGNANLAGSNVVMKGFDMAGLSAALMESNKPLPRVQQILKTSTSSGETKFDSVKGVYTIQNGVVSISSMAMTGPEANIASKGQVSLPRWFIDTTHTVTLANAPDVQPFDVVIKGPLDNPGNTFGSGLFDTFVRQRLQQKVVEELPDVLGKDVTDKLQKFGILPQKQQQQDVVPENTEPASGAESVTSQPKSNEEKAQDAIQGVLKGLLR